MLDALTGGIADLFGDVFEEIYTGAILTKVAKTEAKNGDITVTNQEHDVFHHPVARSEGYRAAAGFADDVLEVIILAKHISGIEIVNGDKIDSSSASYTVVKARLDGAQSQWKCICKEAK